MFAERERGLKSAENDVPRPCLSLASAVGDAHFGGSARGVRAPAHTGAVPKSTHAKTLEHITP